MCLYLINDVQVFCIKLPVCKHAYKKKNGSALTSFFSCYTGVCGHAVADDQYACCFVTFIYKEMNRIL